MSLPAMAIFWMAQGSPDACGMSPHATINVTVNTEPVATSGDYTVADISALARKLANKTSQKPLGFYSGRFFYKLEFNAEKDAGVPCRSHLRIDVETHLTDRVIEIGRGID